MDSTSPSVGQQVLVILAALLSGGVIVTVINKIGNWVSGRSKAEVIEIHTRSVKVEAEAQHTHAQTVMDALERIRELVEINSILQGKLDEAERQRDNAQFDLAQERHELGQLKIQHQLREHFIKQLEAANKLGVKLEDLPPQLSPDTNEDGKPN